jgi:N-acetylmuramoyl-L-alanine amidase
MSQIKIAIDAGHGLSNKTKGVYDPGFVENEVRECDIAYQFALALKDRCAANNVPFFMTRPLPESPCPVVRRAMMAADAGCTHFVSIHANQWDDPNVNGVEVFIRSDKSKSWGETLLGAALSMYPKPKSRGVKRDSESQYSKLAVLNFENLSKNNVGCLVELGFMSNPNDLSIITKRESRIIMADAFISSVVRQWR